MRALVQRLVRSDLVRNAAALYGVQASRKLAPLILIPYLARTLGPAGWGLVAFAQSLGEFLALVIEFGFNLSATREIARSRASRQRCAEIVAGVLGAQMLLALAASAAALAVSRWIPHCTGHPRLLAAALFYGVAQGLTPLWFFQGMERLRLAAALEVSGKAAAVGAILLLVRGPQEGWLVLVFQGLAPAAATLIGITMAYQAVRFRRPSWPLIRKAVERGWRMFVFRSGESLYGAGNAFVLGLFAPPTLVGYFASAEKISRAVFGLLNPIREALYPRLGNLAAAAPERAAKLARAGAIVTTAGGVLLGAGILGFAPWLVRVLMGPEFAPAIGVLRILACLPPLLAVSHSVGLQWLLPNGREGEVSRIILRAGVLNLALAALLAPGFGHVGMAWAVVCSEAFVAACMWRAVQGSGPLFQAAGRAADRSLKLRSNARWSEVSR